jgi:hypothetical protein
MVLSVSAAAPAMAQQDDQQPKRVYGRPFEKGVSQTAKFTATRRQMLDEVIADLERGGRKVSSADKLLVARYVELLRSKSHSHVNSAMKVYAVLTAKYSGKDASAMTAFDKYVAELSAKKDASE